ncbi:MAG: matrixin family metalloprotease [Pirellulales bacterium]
MFRFIHRVLAAIAVCTFSASRADAGYTYLGDPPSKWDIGPNAASEHAFIAPAGPGTPGNATFSIVPAGRTFDNAADTAHGANHTAAITALGVPGFGDEGDYAALFDWALDSWARVSGFTNLGQVIDSGANIGATDADGGAIGDIRIAAWELSSSSLVAHAFQPGTEAIYGLGGTVAGDLHIDVNRNWVDDPLATASTSRFDIYTIVLHEMGHALGLGHSSVRGSVMENAYRGAKRELTADDLAAIRAVYGVPEPSTLVLATIALLTAAFAHQACQAQRRQQQS